MGRTYLLNTYGCKDCRVNTNSLTYLWQATHIAGHRDIQRQTDRQTDRQTA